MESEIRQLFERNIAEAEKFSALSWPATHSADGRMSCTRALQLDIALVENGSTFGLVLNAKFSLARYRDSARRWWQIKPVGWTVEFGFSGGELCLALTNGTSPANQRYESPMTADVPLQIAEGGETSSEETSELGAELGREGPKLVAKVGGKGGSKETRGTTANVSRPRVSPLGDNGNEALPCWRFSAVVEGLPLEGSAPGRSPPLTAVVRTGQPLRVFAAFLVSDGQVIIEKVEPAAGSRRKQKAAVVKKALLKKLREHALTSQDRMLVAYSLRTAPGTTEPAAATAVPGPKP